MDITARAGRVAELLEFMRWDAEVAAGDEPGTLRFDVYAVPDEADAMYLYGATTTPPRRISTALRRSQRHRQIDVLFRSAAAAAINLRT